jgi:GntR family transcriptional regulator / MocR family aminotransferase
MQKASSALLPVIAVDRASAKPLHRQIYDAYRSMILGGSLQPGQQIPSTRALASDLKVSRIPVLTAYSQLLAEGYFETRTGSGTFVCSSLPDQIARADANSTRPIPVRAGSRFVARRTSVLPVAQAGSPWFGLGAFSVSAAAYDEFPVQVWSNLTLRHCRNLQASTLTYGEVLGFEPLRDAVCTYLRTARAVRCEPQQVMIVSGSQEALEISARVLLDTGSPVWMEEPGYWLTRRVLTFAGCRLVPVPVDREGLNVAAGIKRCRKARAAYVAPSHQFPLGVTMSASRRLQLLDWADQSRAWIVEDDYDSEYRYDSMPIASLQGLDSHSRVIYIGTFSKVLFPSLRMGYMVIPKDLVHHFQEARRTINISPPYLYQAVVTDFIREGHFARHIRKMRQLYGGRRTALVECLREELPSTLEALGSEAGMYLAVALAKGFRDVELANLAANEQLRLAPLSPYYLEEPPRQGFLLGFGGVSADEVPYHVQRLKSVLSSSTGRSVRKTGWDAVPTLGT